MISLNKVPIAANKATNTIPLQHTKTISLADIFIKFPFLADFLMLAESRIQRVLTTDDIMILKQCTQPWLCHIASSLIYFINDKKKRDGYLDGIPKT